MVKMPDGEWQCGPAHQSEVKKQTGAARRDSLTGGSFELSPAMMFSDAGRLGPPAWLN